MSANIQTTLYEVPAGAVIPPVTTGNASRDDLRAGNQIIAESVDTHATYQWELSFIPYAPGGGSDFEGTQSSAVLLAPEGSTSKTCKFNVDYDGAYLLTLTVDAGLGTEDTSSVRCRFKTVFGDLKLVAAGEKYEASEQVPSDTTVDGWSEDQNRNFRRLLALVRRASTSGRVLHVDANRGRDASNTQNDTSVTIEMPGPDSAALTTSGISIQSEAFGDFSTVGDAITYAAAAAGRGEAALSTTDPYVIFIQPGLYVEDLDITPHIYLIGLGSSPVVKLLSNVDNPATTTLHDQHSVIIRTANSGGSTHTYAGTTPATELTYVKNILFENTDNTTTTGVVEQTGSLLIAEDCVFLQNADGASQGPALLVETASTTTRPSFIGYNCILHSIADTDEDRFAAVFDAPKSYFQMIGGRIYGGGSAMKSNETQYGGTVASDPRDTVLILDNVEVEGAEYGLRAYNTTITLNNSTFVSADADKALVIDNFGGGAGSLANSANQVVTIRGGRVEGNLVYDEAGVSGTTTLEVDGLSLSGIYKFTTGNPDNFNTQMLAKGLGYEPAHLDPVTLTANVAATLQLTATNVQDAIDELITRSSQFTHVIETVDSGGGGGVRLVVDSATTLVLVDTTTPTPGQVTIELPNTTGNGATVGRQIMIKDEGGGAGTAGREIMIEVDTSPTTPPAGTIDGTTRDASTPLTFTTAYQSVTLVCKEVSGGFAKWFLV